MKLPSSLRVGSRSGVAAAGGVVGRVSEVEVEVAIVVAWCCVYVFVEAED